ncbi:uncharacterized protein LOC122568388 [Bombus pyrosoma]|uniref:uncharacterized protein LOC122568388 n=1 Tax=Bombus pyrosoma TaxID=396416 RepID=UPI001CB92755|nr:uncharacterized protein LOC122568388 [Bombus pyrosoma]
MATYTSTSQIDWLFSLEASELLQKLKRIPMECFDIENSEFSECEGSEPGEREIEICSDKRNSNISDKENKSSESKSENILNARKRRRARVLSSSESEIENVQASLNEIAVNETKWERIQEGSASGRLPLHNIFKDISGPQDMQKKYHER